MDMISKLPNVGTTIFTKMSKMAQEHDAINLSQGFPDFPVDPVLIDRVYHYMNKGFNQYAPMPGVPELRKAVAELIANCYDWKADWDKNITITCGAIEAIMSTITALVHPGDEVIILEPAYDAYEPIIKLQGARAVGVSLRPDDYSIDWKLVWDSISDRTRMIIINSPHNPTGSIISAEDLEALEEIVEETGILVLSDEVYEHIVFDQAIHQSVLRSEKLRHRSVAISSFGKTFHVTGWRIGYLVAPENLMIEIKKVHQYNAFTIHTPTQYAIADYLEDGSKYRSLSDVYQQKRDFFLKLMAGSKFKPIASSGSYFQLMDYSELSQENDVEFSEWLTKEIGVASIPTSVFYQNRQDNKVLRFCFAKSDETLEKAATLLRKL